MARSAFILMPGEHAWRIAQVSGAEVRERTVDTAAGALATAEPLKQALADLGHRGEPLTVLLPSRWCLAASIDTTALPRRGRREAMVYALEEKLPLAAEEFVADFIESRGSALGVAASADKLTSLTITLEAIGLRVRSIAPAALLALSTVKETDGLVAIAGFDGLDVFTMQGGKPVSWRVSEDTPVALRREAAVYLAARNEELTPSAITAVNMRRVDAGPLAAAAHLKPSIDLLPPLMARRQGNAAGRAMRYAGAALILFGLIVPAAMMWRAQRYDEAAAHYRQAQQAVYASRFSGPAPVGVLRVFQSELKAAKAAGGGLPLHGYDSALHLMHDALGNIPDQTQVRLRRVRFTTDRIELAGEAASKDDAYAVHTALSGVRGLAAEVTQLEDSGGGAGGKEVRFTIVARPPAPSAGKGAAR